MQKDAIDKSLKRQTLHIKFSTGDNACEVTMDDDPRVYVAPVITDALRRPLTAWDLHIGATVVVLGRKTTLKQVRSAHAKRRIA